MPPRYTGPAMDLANMRSLGVTAVAVECACGRRESVDMSGLPGDLEVPALKRRLRCPACAARPLLSSLLPRKKPSFHIECSAALHSFGAWTNNPSSRVRRWMLEE